MAKDIGDLVKQGGPSALAHAIDNAKPMPADSANVVRPVELTGEALFDSLFESMDDFMARAENLPPPSWLLEELVPASGQIWILAAPGTGKTWFALALAKLAAESGRFVLIIEEEGGARGFYERLKRFSFTPETRKLVRIAHRKNIKLIKDEVRKALVQHIKGLGKPPVIIIDPATAVFSGDENNTQEAAMFRDQLGEIVQAFNDTLVLVLHHTSKDAEKNKAITYAGRGSTTWTGGADMEIVLRKSEEPFQTGLHKFKFEVGKAPRDFPEPPKKAVTIVLDTGDIQPRTLEQGEEQPVPSKTAKPPPPPPPQPQWMADASRLAAIEEDDD